MDTQEESLATQMGCMAVGSGKDAVAVEWAKYSKRVLIKKIVGRPDGGQGLVGQRVVVGGWVKTGREQGKNTFVFLEINDGSCPTNLQVLVDCSAASHSHLTATGTCIMVEGELKQPPEGTKQRVELQVEMILEVGTVEPKYPIAKTKLSMEYLRGFMHLRSRTNTDTRDGLAKRAI